MSQQQGLILVVSDDRPPALTAALGEAMFPLIEVDWADASRAITKLQPAVVIAAAGEGTGAKLDALAVQINAVEPYLPLLAINPKDVLPDNAIPFTQANGKWDRL